MSYCVLILVFLVSRCGGLNLEHNCSSRGRGLGEKPEIMPKAGDIPLLNRKILKGTRVSIIEHPYIVSIRRQMVHYLTGTLIGEELIATVAHPIIGVPINELSVVTGQNYNDRGSVIYTVILIIIHEDFDPSTLRADLALLRVHEDIVYRVSTKPIKKVLNNRFPINRAINAFLTGWGRCENSCDELCLPRASVYYPNEYMDPMLRSISLVISEKAEACEAYVHYEVFTAPGMLCAGPSRREEPAAPCLAVPGAPLVVSGGRLLGLLSWGFGCGYSLDMPLVYTDLRYYSQWIEGNSYKLSKLNQKNFSVMFEATKASILYEWFAETRQAETTHDHPKMEIQSWEVDRLLALMNGDLYDIRDFFGHGKFHEEKYRRYAIMRKLFLEENVNTTTVASYTDMRYEHRFRETSDSDESEEYDYEHTFPPVSDNEVDGFYQDHETTTTADHEEYS